MRRISKIILCILMLAALSYAQPTYVNGTTNATGLFTCSMTLSLTAGNTLVVIGSSSTTSSNTITVASAGFTFTQITGSPFLDSGGYGLTAVWTAPIPSTASTTTTVTVSNDTNYFSCNERQYTGNDSVDQISTVNSNFGTSLSTNSVTTGTANEALVGIFWVASVTTFTPTAPFGNAISNGSSSSFVASEDESVTSTGTYTAFGSIPINNGWGSVLFSLKGSSGGVSLPCGMSILRMAGGPCG